MTDPASSLRPRCVVALPAQPRFADRYETAIQPAIVAAGLDPYRVVPRSSVDEVEHDVRHAQVCVLDLSANDAAVWFALGVAVAAGRPSVVLCERARRDQAVLELGERSVLFYDAHSSLHLDELAAALEERLRTMPAASVFVPLRVALGVTDNRVLRKLAEGDVRGPHFSPGWLSTELRREGIRDRDIAIALQRLLAIGAIGRRIRADTTEGYEYRITAEGRLRAATLDDL